MSSMSVPSRDKWSMWVGLAWIVAALAVLGGIVVISEMSRVPVPSGTMGGGVEYRTNYLIVGAAAGQALGAVFLAVIMSMLNSIYKNSCQLLQESRPTQPAAEQPEISDGPSAADEAAQGRGVKVGYINEASPLYSLVKVGNVVLSINGTEVFSVRQASGCLIDGENCVSYLDHQGNFLERKFKASVNDSLGIKPA